MGPHVACRYGARHTKAGGEADVAAFKGNLKLFDFRTQAFGQSEGVVQTAVDQQDDKFFTAITCQNVASPIDPGANEG